MYYSTVATTITKTYHYLKTSKVKEESLLDITFYKEFEYCSKKENTL